MTRIREEEEGELSQWLCYDDSTINIVLYIIIIIIIKELCKVFVVFLYTSHTRLSDAFRVTRPLKVEGIFTVVLCLLCIKLMTGSRPNLQSRET